MMNAKCGIQSGEVVFAFMGLKVAEGTKDGREEAQEAGGVTEILTY